MLLWVDTETTGLDPDKDALLEVALVVTTNTLEVCWEDSWVLPFEQGNIAIDPYVQKMHEKNGLWKACLNQHSGHPADVQHEIIREARVWTEPGTVPMCGSTIGFDRAFLKKHMPDLEKHFHYRNLDVSSFGELAMRLYPEAYANRPKADGNHRALSDVQGSIALLRYWRQTVMR
jgi:oligoribonuclease